MIDSRAVVESLALLALSTARRGCQGVLLTDVA